MKYLKQKPLNLQTWLTMLVCIVVLSALLASGYLIGSQTTSNVRNSQAEKVMNIANIVSKTPLVIDGLTGAGPIEAIQTYTKTIRKDTHVQYIVVMNNEHIRLSHPIPDRIGELFVGNDENKAFQGEQYTSIAHGTLGESMRAFAPIWDGDQQVGVVAVGMLVDNIETAVYKNQKSVYLGISAGLLIGLFGAILLARRVKQTLFGLEPREIAQLLVEREAMLESVREGIIAVNDENQIIVANHAAIQLFRRAHLNENPIGQPVQSYLPPSPLTDAFISGESLFDQEQQINGIHIIVNKVSVTTKGQFVGTIATFRDKSELTSLVKQLVGAKTYAETLRAKTHEFMNKLHVITAMVHTKSYDELKDYLSFLSDSYQRGVGSISKLVKDPVIAGYLLNKLSAYRESGVQIELLGDHPLPSLKQAEHMDKIITIIGNLFDNAYDAISGQDKKQIGITINYMDDFFHFCIKDNGPGLLVDHFDYLSEKGVSTKGKDRGYGLYLINEALRQLNGTINVSSSRESGTEICVKFPYEGEGK